MSAWHTGRAAFQVASTATATAPGSLPDNGGRQGYGDQVAAAGGAAEAGGGCGAAGSAHAVGRQPANLSRCKKGCCCYGAAGYAVPSALNGSKPKPFQTFKAKT